MPRHSLFTIKSATDKKMLFRYVPEADISDFTLIKSRRKAGFSGCSPSILQTPILPNSALCPVVTPGKIYVVVSPVSAKYSDCRRNGERARRENTPVYPLCHPEKTSSVGLPVSTFKRKNLRVNYFTIFFKRAYLFTQRTGFSFIPRGQ